MGISLGAPSAAPRRPPGPIALVAGTERRVVLYPQA
jgi:hypothetical protein